MALNFPDTPTLNQIYNDETSGFSYQWDGTVWQSYSSATSKNISIVDTFSSSFNGSTNTFSLAVSGSAITPANSQQLIVVLGGIVQAPGIDYTVSGSSILFTTPPSSGLDCSIVYLGISLPINTIGDGTVTPAKLSAGGPSWNTGGDLSVTGVITASSATISGNVSIAGTLTYEDVTNIDSVGLITARSGIEVTGGITATGVITATGGFNLGISSSGTTITSGPIKTLNFVGLGNTFSVSGTTANISIQGGDTLDITSCLFL